MPSGRFTPFETLLLTSRSQADTAGLLLLAWVMASRGPLTEAQRRQLTSLASECRHGHELTPIFDLANRQDFDAIQLAAEVMQKDRGGEQAYPFLRQAIALSVIDGEPSIAQHHVLRFLADLLGVIPSLFATLYAEQAGRPYAVPEDPSRRDYWLAKEHQRQREEARQQEQDERRREQEARERQEEALRRQREREARERQEEALRRQRERREQEARERERQRQEQARRERAQQDQERARQERARQERHNADQNRRWQQASPNDPRAHRALAVLGLPPGANRAEIRKAYRRMAQTHHPDRFYAQGEARMATASQRFQRIKNAYEYLMRAS
ncbi:DnaJ domain-containing protein [Onishia taeanensis]|uniref:DnaJ domain-containing protein n=1 Tax=Onishia taeanensis TaxID=284577 RepID=A0A1G7TK76_9GAMM|nr:J domain-containing protein [Halomonas taeanensis]SDG34910.1 DnaJ domain-containing protein [Halomonas taeanensis]